MKNKIIISAIIILAAQTNIANAAIKIEKWQLENGAQVWFSQSKNIPILDLQIDFDAGARRVSENKSGLAGITALMSLKGTKAINQSPAKDENQLGEQWADLAATFTAVASSDKMSFSLRTLTQPEILSSAINLARNQLAAPAFEKNILKREKEIIKSSIKESLTRPQTIASIAFQKAVYQDHPYGYQTTENSVDNINVEDLENFYKKYIQTCNAKISIIGDITKEKAKEISATLLSNLPVCKNTNFEKVAEVKPLENKIEKNIEFKSEQSHILIGQKGYKRDDPEFFALLVGNQILGAGGFTSRLVKEVREKNGLSYSVYSSFSPRLHAGAFQIGLQTSNKTAQKAREISISVLKDFINQGPTEEELKAAKDNLINSFALRLDSNSRILGNIANIAWNNLPLDYLDNWTDKVQKVTAQDIQKAFKNKINPENLAIITVGNSVNNEKNKSKE